MLPTPARKSWARAAVLGSPPVVAIAKAMQSSDASQALWAASTHPAFTLQRPAVRIQRLARSVLICCTSAARRYEAFCMAVTQALQAAVIERVGSELDSEPDLTVCWVCFFCDQNL